jgi:uncharacterized protein (TIGR02302 family)
MDSLEKSRNLTLWRLRWQLRLTWAGLWAEVLARRFWPLSTLILACYAALVFGFFDTLPQRAFVAVLGALGALGTFFLLRGLVGLRRPGMAEARARLDETLPGRPLRALTDSPVIGTDTPAGAAVWHAHLQRMAELAAKARAPAPNLGLAARDPFGLRYIALTLATIAALFGGAGQIGGLIGAGAGPAQALVAGPVWEGWVRPPAYTGKPAIYLNDTTQEALELPQGSRVILRFYGNEAGSIGLEETVSATPLPQDAFAQGHEFEIARTGRIVVTGPRGRAWDIAMLRDMAPSIRATAAPEREADGRMKLPFEAEDDYAIIAGQAEITLDLAAMSRRYGLIPDPEPRAAITLDLPLPFTGKRDLVREILVDDLSQHPFANLPVLIRLQATDGMNQTGDSAPLATVLPGKRFFDPLAAAVIEARRDLLWSRDNAVRVNQVLRAVTHRPEGFIRNERAFLRLRAAIRGISSDLTPEARDEIAAELWAIAELIEQGDLDSALERLKRAQDRLDEAMRNGASESEIAELMQELRDALDNYMRQLAQEAERDPNQQNSDLEGMQMSGNQLQELLDRLQQLMEEGRMAEAQELMEMLRQLMENMQVTQGPGGQGQGEGQQGMRDLADTLRDQQGLSDEAFRDLQDQFNDFRQDQQQGEGEGQGENEGEGQGDNGQAQQGETGEGADDRSLAERQRDLRNRLRALGHGEFPGDGSERGQTGRRELDRAGRAMEGAEEALREGDLPRALDRQAEAMEALRQGMREFAEALTDEQLREGGENQHAGQSDPAGRRDPLGRDLGQMGRLGTDQEMLQGEDVYRRAEDLMEELRRRSGEQTRPEQERDYLRRLLERF